MGLQHWWKTGAAPNDYEFGLSEESFEGQPVAYLRSIVQQARSFGAFCQTIAAEDYRGKRIRFSAALKASEVTDGWGGLWLTGRRGPPGRDAGHRHHGGPPPGGHDRLAGACAGAGCRRGGGHDRLRCRAVWEGGAAGVVAGLRGGRQRGAGHRRRPSAPAAAEPGLQPALARRATRVPNRGGHSRYRADNHGHCHSTAELAVPRSSCLNASHEHA